jgi:hypothetical protein
MKKTIAAIRLLLTLTCHESARLMSAAEDRKLTDLESWALRLHFIGCHSCRRFRAQLRHLRRITSCRLSPETTEMIDDGRLSTAARQRIAVALHKAQGSP